MQQEPEKSTHANGAAQGRNAASVAVQPRRAQPARPSRFARRGARRAAAFMLVLVAASLIGFIVTEIIAGGIRRLTWEAQRGGDDELRSEAFSALESTLGVLAAFSQTDGALHGPAQGWGDPLAFAGHAGKDGVKLSVTLRDESGLYGINALAANPAAMRRFLVDLGVGDSEAGNLSACLADWTDAGDSPRLNGAERESYADGVAPPNRPLQSLEELRDVLGFRAVFFDADGNGNELWQRLAAAVSLLSDSTQPNVNTAPRAVLEILAARHSFSPEAILARRGDDDSGGNGNGGGAAGSVFRNASDLTRVGAPPALGTAVTFSSTRLRIIVRAARADTAVVLDTLLSTGEAGTTGGAAGGATGTGGGGATASSRAGQFPFTILQQRVNARLQD